MQQHQLIAPEMQCHVMLCHAAAHSALPAPKAGQPIYPLVDTAVRIVVDDGAFARLEHLHRDIQA